MIRQDTSGLHLKHAERSDASLM